MKRALNTICILLFFTQDAVATRIMNGGVLIHCLIAYQIDLNVATYTFLSLVRPVALGAQYTGYSPLADGMGHTSVRRSGWNQFLTSLFGDPFMSLIV